MRRALPVCLWLLVSCGGGGGSTPTTPSEIPSNQPATPLQTAIAQNFDRLFGEKVFRPALYDNFANCGGDHITTTAWIANPEANALKNSRQLLQMYVSSDGATVTRSSRGTTVAPVGTFSVLVALINYPQTMGGDPAGRWTAAQAQINEDHASFARSHGYSAPIVTFNNTNVLVDPAQIADPRSRESVTSALQKQGVNASTFDILVSVNIDPSKAEGGFTQPADPSSLRAFIFMGNFSSFRTALTADNMTSIARAVYHHEVAHNWGWPGTHDWASCSNGFTTFIVPPVLMGWEDTDGDGVPEILDSTPYGRSKP